MLVAGHGAEAVEAAAQALDDEIVVVRAGRTARHRPCGGAGAPRRWTGFAGDAVVLYGDTPFIRAETLEAMAAARAEGADVVVLGFEAADPGRYGRLVVEDGALHRIVEFKDATEAERAITLCNSGVVMADAARAVRPGRRGRQRQCGGRILPDRHRRDRPRARPARGRGDAATRPRRWASTPAPNWPRPRRCSRPAPAPRRSTTG